MNTVITSFTEEGYELYGKEFIRTFKQFWPDNVRLVVYYEGDDVFRRMQGWEDYWQVRHIKDFMDALTFDIQKGILPDGQYNINLDARMARKPFMQAHALEQYGGKVFWLDADSVTHSAVPYMFLDELLPDDKLCCYLGRHTASGERWYYTESGCLGWNSKHPLCERFMRAYKDYFLFGAWMTHKIWHDCEAFDELRASSGAQDQFVNLAAHLPQGTMHVFINSVLGTYMDHRKGPRKHSRSTGKDLVIDRSEPYWRNQNAQQIQEAG